MHRTRIAEFFMTLFLLLGALLTSWKTQAQSKAEFILADLSNPNATILGEGHYAIQFTGAGGVHIRTKGVSLLADPFYSNPGIGELLMLKQLMPDERTINKWLINTESVAGILVGHGHYDHLMDVPYIMRGLSKDARVYGSNTAIHMIASQVDKTRRVPLNTFMASVDHKGQWVTVHPRIRILPIRSEHSPHVAGIVFASDTLVRDSVELPEDVLEWQSGTTLSYVIDFLGASEIGEKTKNNKKTKTQFRVFYQSSSSGFPTGAPPDWLKDDGIPFDLAILCMANFDKVENYPAGILAQLQPKQVLLTHWEVFWDSYVPNEAQVLPGLDIDAFHKIARSVLPEETPIYLPQRGASIVIQK